MRLLQVSWAEILTLQLAHRSIPFSGRLCFATDFWLDEKFAKECGAIELYNHVSNLFSLILIIFSLLYLSVYKLYND